MPSGKRRRKDATAPGGSQLLKRAEGHIQSRVVSGILELLPIVVPVVVVVYVVNLVDSVVVPLVEGAVRRLSGGALGIPNIWGIGLVLTIMAFYLAGLMCSTKLGGDTVALLTNAMARIPVIRWLLGATRQATGMATSQFHFSRAVFIEWPREGMVALGFVMARVSKPGTGESLAIVYIPTAPNPTSGNMALVNEDDLFETDMTTEDAMKLVFSGGIVTPDSIALGRMPVEFRVQSTYTGRFERQRPGRESTSDSV